MHDIEYKISEKVWARNHILSSAAQAIAAKLSPKYTGPFIVTARIGMNSYKLQTEQGVNIGNVAVCDLKPCYDEEQFPEDAPEPQDSDSIAPELPISPKKDEHAAIVQPASSTEATAGSASQISTSVVPKRSRRPRGSKKEENMHQKSKAVIKISKKLLWRISRLVRQLITAQASEILPTLGEPTQLSDLLRSLGEAIRTTTEPSLDQLAAILPALHPGREELRIEQRRQALQNLQEKKRQPHHVHLQAHRQRQPTAKTLQRRKKIGLSSKPTHVPAVEFAKRPPARKEKHTGRCLPLPSGFLDNVQKAVALQEHLDKAEAQWQEEQKQEVNKKALKLEPLKKLHEHDL
ncbi:hypothetical protein TSAR_012751 [Trichomalopsis sarcophagae]|uniref:Uncharacterized protein n=1 Tax=Trichomalopsis sarcophagae TaxID=543379 RepID=A0A232EK21_9HYME|nr:hypothetical protein TSAR_012751 [Trichomalopsis sarcophagae]